MIDRENPRECERKIEFSPNCSVIEISLAQKKKVTQVETQVNNNDTRRSSQACQLNNCRETFSTSQFSVNLKFEESAQSLFLLLADRFLLFSLISRGRFESFLK